MNDLHIVAAFLVVVLAAARLTRLVIFDTWPPVAALRGFWIKRGLDDHPWGKGLLCPYCLAPWMAAVVAAVGFATAFHAAWWIIGAWLGASYLASIVVAYDGDE